MARRIVIVGAGAAGLACAVTAARLGASVTLFEAKDRVGSSILATGNGRCNISNSQVSAADYHNAPFVEQAFKVLPPWQVWEFFQDLGLLMRQEGEGRMYPLPNKASAVLDVLRFAAEEASVNMQTNAQVVQVRPGDGRHLLVMKDGQSAFFDAVVIAVGGGVARKLLPSSYPFVNQHKLLCGLKTDTEYLRGMDNVRVRCKASLAESVGTEGVGGPDAYGGNDVRMVAEEEGEVQFRDYGVSGVAVFNLSRFAQPGHAVLLDFLPWQTEQETCCMLADRRKVMGDRDGVSFLSGIVLPAVARNVLKKAGLDPAKPVKAGDVRRLAAALRRFDIRVTGFQDKTSQVQRGGFAVESFDGATLQSKLDRGIYAVGEALDVDGPCGGYNLHWAWTSGILAGRSCGKGE